MTISRIQHLDAALPTKVLVLSLLATNPAAAQDASGPASTAEQPDTGTLAEVIVSAQRRDERLQDVPISVVNLRAETLSQANVQSLSEIDKLTSGIRFDKRTNFVVPTIRGITTSIVLAGGGSNIGVYLDGFYSPALQASDFQLINVKSVQVLKGPQGTLFGRNTNGGAVLINTAGPSTDGKMIVEAGYGSYNAQRYQAYATIGLTDAVAMDFAGSFSTGDGWTTNIANGDDKVGKYENGSLRAGMKVQVTDNFSLLARYAFNSVDDPTNLLQVPYVLNGRPAATAAYVPGAIVATDQGEVSGDEEFEYRFESDIYQLTATLDLDVGTLTSYSQYRTDNQSKHSYSLDYTNVPLLALDIHDFNKTLTQEFLFTSKTDGPLEYTVGAFYFDAEQSFPFVGIGSQGAPPTTFSSASGVNNKSIAVYGDLTYEIVPNLFLTGGLRYTWDRVEDAYYTVGANRVTTTLPTLDTERLTPRAVVRYKLSERSSVYASYSEGYKAAIYNVGGLVPDSVEPEELKSFEVGYKFNSRDLSANLSSYYYDYSNQQVVSGVIVNGNPVSRIRNAASSLMYGIEGDVLYQVTTAFQVTAGAAWSHARYDNFPNAPAFTWTANNAFPQSPIDASGFHMLRAPDFSANLGASYTTEMAKGSLVFAGNLFYTSEFYFDAAQQIPEDEYALLGLRAEWTDSSDRFTLALSGKNVTDTKYRAQGALNALGVNSVWGAPATVEASVRVKFE